MMDLDVLDDDDQQNTTCGSVDNLQAHLASLYQSKVTETRAHHISSTFELRAAGLFNLMTTDAENEALDSLPFLDSTRPSEIPNNDSGFMTRTVSAMDCLMQQSHDDPVLQKIVSKHIVNSISSVDISSWVVRQVSRAAQGWIFTYICKDSMQAWLRQKPVRPPVGECSTKTDPIHEQRPAFDCRGSLTISFQESSRIITVKYDHTPMHKTVADLLALHAPPPPPQREPTKKRRAPVAAAANGTEEAGTAEGRVKRLKPKQRKKSKAPETPAMVLHNREQANGGQAEGQAPKGNVYTGPDPALAHEEPAAIDSGLNVAPEEAERRKEVAMQLLTASGLDPDTLSTDQFNIFSNQSPELQKESLTMLVKYGAERLRIVHPTRDAVSAHANANSGKNSSHNQSPAETPKKSRKKRKSGPTAAAPGPTPESTPEVGPSPPVSTPTTGKLSRGACITCKSRKVKCPLQKPSCSNCAEIGVVCEYPIAKPRKPRNSEVVVTQNNDYASAPEEQAPAPAPAPELQLELQRESEPELQEMQVHQPEPEPEPEPEAIPPETPISPPVPDPSVYMFRDNQLFADMYKQNTGLSYSSHVSSVIDDYQEPQEQQKHHQQQVQPQPQQQQASPSMSSQPMPRRYQGTLPTAPANTQPAAQAAPAPQNTSTSSSWQTISTTAIPPPTDTSTPSPTLTPAQVEMRTQRAAQNQVPFDPNNSGGYDAVQQTIPFQQHSVSTSNQSPVLAQASPNQSHNQSHSRTPPQTQMAKPANAQAKSRQGHRTRTPVANQSTSRPQQTTNPAVTTNAAKTPSQPSYNLYGRHSNSSSRDTGNGNTVSDTSRIAYEPYSHHPLASTLNYSYQYDTRSSPNTTSNSHNANSAAEVMPSSTSYSAGTSTQWPTSQTRNTNSYSSNSNTTTSYSPPSTTSKAHENVAATVGNFNVRPSVTSHNTRSGSGTSYGQQSQQQQQQQQQHNTEQQQTYNSYQSQTQQSNANQQQQSWYGGFNSTNNSTYKNSPATRSATSNYSANTSTNSAYHHGYQTRQMGGIPGNGYGAADGDSAAFYDLMRSNQGH